MLITVTQKNIDEGVRTSCYRCPIALALKEHYPYHETFAAYGSLRVGESIDVFKCPTPQVAQDFIQAFDRGNPVQPFSFEVENTIV